jgi:protein gp37
MPGTDVGELNRIVLNHIPGDVRASHVLVHLKTILAAILADGGQSQNATVLVELDIAVRSLFRCSAGCFTLNRAGKVQGFPGCFDVPTLFPGRMAKAATARDLTGRIRPDKPWLDHLPRLIAIGDLGECLAPGIAFQWLRSEVIDAVTSTKGKRHIWLWSTKQTARMIEFSEWLWDQGVNWPENLVPIASVTGQDTVYRVHELVKLNVPVKGIAVEPLWQAVELPLSGIDWLMVGGEVGPWARPFPLRWARDIQQQCEERGVAFFLSQFGRIPRGEGFTIKLRDKDGGDWNEWPIDLHFRQFPEAFSRNESVEASAEIRAEAIQRGYELKPHGSRCPISPRISLEPMVART